MKNLLQKEFFCLYSSNCQQIIGGAMKLRGRGGDLLLVGIKCAGHQGGDWAGTGDCSQRHGQGRVT